MQAKFPWSLFLLIGGSMAMAHGMQVEISSVVLYRNWPYSMFQVSGLSKLIGDTLAKLSFLSPLQLCIVTAILTGIFTEFVNNSAAATIITPVVFAVVCFKFRFKNFISHFETYSCIFQQVGKNWFESAVSGAHWGDDSQLLVDVANRIGSQRVIVFVWNFES